MLSSWCTAYMPNLPLPKPSIPTTLTPSTGVSGSGTAPIAPAQASPSIPSPTPASPPTPSASTSPLPAAPATPVSAQPTSTMPLVPQAPVIGGRQAPPPTMRQAAVAAPPARGAAGSFTPQQPTAAPVVTPPPKSLTALQSMASNTLPAGAGMPLPPGAPQPGRTVAQPLTSNPSLTAPEKGTEVKKPQPDMAQPKKSPLRFLPHVLGGIVLLAALGWAAMTFLGGGSESPTSPANQANQPGAVPPTQQVSLEYWGLWEPTEVMEEVIADYERQNPGTTIVYSKQSHRDYRERLRNALVSGNGPDLFRFHATWVPMMQEELAPLPSAVMTGPEYSQAFYPVAAQQLKNRNDLLVGIPLMYEGLALYYNTDIFSTAVVDPPSTWPELRQLANQLTIRSGSTIQRAGIAMGNATNTEHFSDILAVLLLQNNADLYKPNSPETRDALDFYTLFTRTDRVWDESQPLSSVAFARGDVAMMFAPSWRAHEVKANNPNLQFKVVPLPQLTDQRITWANYWAEGVSSFSSNKDAAWKFLKYLSSAEVQKKMHSDQSSVRPFGEIYSRVDLRDELASDPIMGAYVRDASTARGWPMSSYTHDDGLNDQIIKYYEEAITSINQGKSVDDVMPTLEQGVNQVLRQYGLTVN